MALHFSPLTIVLLFCIVLVVLPSPAHAFGAGNIASISKIEGHNWRHGDIEDMLKTVACIKGHKWTAMMVKRTYFGNWLRDYSQAVDVGTLKGVQADTIRVLVWILSFLSFGYATAEFEVTSERLGVYRPEEHIDNPKDYADNLDARQFDQRLRGPVEQIELQIDPQTGMKNYIANENGGWSTSAAYIRYSFGRSIHYGRMYCKGVGGPKGREEDLSEALRCLGQGLHCLEDFGAHTNYTELALREMGFHNVFTHTGIATEINLNSKRVFPLVTGTFGGVDFLHSVLGEANDHFAQTEVDEMDTALGDAQVQSKRSGGDSSTRSLGGSSSGSQCAFLTSMLSKVPGAGDLCREAEKLQAESDAQEHAHSSRGLGGPEYGSSDPYSTTRAGPGQQQTPYFAAPPGQQGGPPGPGIPGMDPSMDPVAISKKIYPILEFRDKVVKRISAVIEKIPGLSALVDKITETLTLFVLSLLAPFIRPIITAVSNQLKTGSSAVIDASGKHQYEPWTDPNCTDPTHSLLSKDHFSNILNPPAGQIAATILKHSAPLVLEAWQHPDQPEDQVFHEILQAFHHPAARNPHSRIQSEMFNTVDKWVKTLPDHGQSLNSILSSESVRAGKNHKADLNEAGGGHGHGHGHGGGQSQQTSTQHNYGSFANSVLGKLGVSNPLPDPSKLTSHIPGVGSGSSAANPTSKLFSLRPQGFTRDTMDETADTIQGAYPGTAAAHDNQMQGPYPPAVGDPYSTQTQGTTSYAGQQQQPESCTGGYDTYTQQQQQYQQPYDYSQPPPSDPYANTGGYGQPPPPPPQGDYYSQPQESYDSNEPQGSWANLPGGPPPPPGPPGQWDPNAPPPPPSGGYGYDYQGGPRY
ncbi:MAG: hypothetical protein M1834_005270 [Cirrosporium novae-zelandiae]|nr:MAG: hypothetical protein M1834_005270 [Cirrosporium novae-zelandiae]